MHPGRLTRKNNQKDNGKDSFPMVCGMVEYCQNTKMALMPHALLRKEGGPFCISISTGQGAGDDRKEKHRMDRMKVRVLILPIFEVGGPESGFHGEAQYFYEAYLQNAEVFEIPGADGLKLYYRDGVALCLLGMGKISAALNTVAVLSDSRFDFSESYILSTGCAGSAAETSVMGDVFVISAAVDYDLGHHADSSELADPDAATWFHDAMFDKIAVIRMDPRLTDRVYALVKDVPLSTTERTRGCMKEAFGGADWALRDPRVLRGTAVTGDNYWKGARGHRNALLMVKTYGCPDPYAVSEMEDVAVARAAERMGMLDRLIIIRDSVNMDVFMLNTTPESLWGAGAGAANLMTENNDEAADIFETAMRNNFAVSSVIINRILDGRF